MRGSGKRKVAPKSHVATESPRAKRERLLTAVVCTLLAAIVFLVFGQSVRHEFINYDDPQYVYENPRITNGLTVDGIKWAFTQEHGGNWHPLTSISHMLDCEFFGVRPAGHHFTNVLLHALATVFLFLAMRRLTGRLWPSALVAGLFAIHPLRVESVAWISERKDVLSGVFFMLTLWAYARYAKSSRFSAGRYATVIILFALGLMCKPTLVTLPFVLLLLDYWPLRRVASSTHVPQRGASITKPFGSLLVEKWPLFLLSAISCLVTLVAQKQAVTSVNQLKFGERIANAILSYVTYLGQMFWPTNLAVVYPYDAAGSNIAAVSFGLVLLLIVSGLFLVWRRKFPFLIVGWIWFIGVLVPMIGLVQVGVQVRADRYTYLAQIGLYVLLTWSMIGLLNKRRYGCPVLVAMAVLVVAGLSAASYAQTSYWQSSEKLWNRVLVSMPNNSIAENNLGLALREKGKLDDAITHLRKAVENCTNCSDVYNNLGNAYSARNDWAEAAKWYRSTIQSAPKPDARNHNNLGICLVRTGKAEEALAQFREAVRINGDLADAQYNMAMLLVALKQPDEAVTHFKEVLRLKPDDQQVKEELRRLGGR